MSLRDVIPTRSLVLALPAAVFVVVMGLGARSPVDYALGVLVMFLVIVAVEAVEGMLRDGPRAARPRAGWFRYLRWWGKVYWLTSAGDARVHLPWPGRVRRLGAAEFMRAYMAWKRAGYPG